MKIVIVTIFMAVCLFPAYGNHNLEEQAKAIFKSWFLDFSALDNPDFYSYEGVTCPVGWRVSYLADIADYLNGLAMQKYRPDEGDFWLSCAENKRTASKNVRQGQRKMLFSYKAGVYCS